MAKKNENGEEPIETQLWKAADKLGKNIDFQFKSLAALRATMLPKLMSGEVRVETSIESINPKQNSHAEANH